MSHSHQSSNGGWKPEFPMPSHDEQYYVHTTEEIPLSKMSDEEKRSNERAAYLSAQARDKRHSINSIYNASVSKVSLVAKPFFNIVVSSFFTVALLLIYLYADGKPIDFQIIGLKIPALVSLMLMINIILVTGGISTAVAEYKWVRLRNGAQLTIIDVYDSCTRGLGGFFTAIKALYFDWVLMLAMFFHVGLLIVGPASQEILVPIVNDFTAKGIDVGFYHFPASHVNDRTGLKSTGMAAKLNGLATNSYITTASFVQAATNVSGHPIFKCPSNANYCEFNNVTYISTSMTCNNITENDTAIVNRDNLARYNIVLKEYFTSANITFGSKKTFPKFLYSTEMLNRTYYDLANYTAPINALNIPEAITSKTEYDPRFRPYAGEQIFVMAYKKDNMYARGVKDYTELAFQKCYFNSSLNISTWRTSEGQLNKVSDDSSVPIILDFDNVIGNNIALNSLSENPTNAIMVNAYIMQQALLKELIEPVSYTMDDYMSAWSNTFGVRPANPFEEFMKGALPQFDYAFFQAPYISGDRYSSITVFRKEGLAYYTMKPQYLVRKGAGYALSLCLFLPTIWWIIIWIISMKKTGGVARGNSQIALLATGMTPLAEHNLRGFSNLGEDSAFKRARKIRVRVGTITENQHNRVALGMDGEDNLRPLK